MNTLQLPTPEELKPKETLFMNYTKEQHVAINNLYNTTRKTKNIINKSFEN
jgi:hypothetical protein